MSEAPEISVVIAPSAHGGRLSLTVRSAIASIAATGRSGEVVVGLATGDALHRSVAAGLDEVRVQDGSTATSHAAVRAGRGSILVLVRSGDLLPAPYVGALAEAVGRDAAAVLRPAVVATYGGAPSSRRQTPLGPTAEDRSRAVFAAPFAPPLAARADLLASLPDRPFDLAADWRWTLDTQDQGVRHCVVDHATYVAWAPALVAPVLLPMAAAPWSDPEARCAELRAELEAMRRSTSWRATRPLRALTSALRGAR